MVEKIYELISLSDIEVLLSKALICNNVGYVLPENSLKDTVVVKITAKVIHEKIVD